MKYALPLFLFSVLAASLALPQSNPVPSTTKKTTSKTVTTPKKTASSRTASSKTASSKKGKSTKKPAATAASWRSRQLTPTPERYKEIQQALADKGYLKSEPNGVWDPQSADALRQFQTDKQLSVTGKLSSASLIALGLGPKTAAASPSSTIPTGDAPAVPPSTPEN